MKLVRPTRRQFFAGVGGALVLASGVVATLRTHGYDLPDDVAGKLVGLEPWQYVLVQTAARRICAADVDDGSVPTADDTDVAGFVDAYVAGMPPALKSDLQGLFALVEHGAPVACGFSTRFSKLDAASQDRVLAWLESNDVSLLRGGFAGLKSLLFMGFYRDPRTWKIVRYDGPKVGRPALGW